MPENKSYDFDVANWAASMTDTLLAANLRSLSRDIRFWTPAERTAILIEAAHRLERESSARVVCQNRTPDGMA